jgi:hypothetical protein
LVVNLDQQPVTGKRDAPEVNSLLKRLESLEKRVAVLEAAKKKELDGHGV